jgi:hypothetical protein
MMIAAVDQDGAFILGMKGGVPSTWKICSSPDDGTASGTHTALSWGDSQSLWDVGERCHQLIVYGEWGEVWAIKEASTWKMLSRKFYRTSPAEMANTIDDRNGEAAMVHGVYLEYSWHDSAVRFFRNNLDGVNPNKAEYGLPDDRRGNISCMAAYPGMTIYGYDGGNDNYSHILAHNGFGFFEIFRAPDTGMRIHGMKIQSIPGNNVDRLMFDCGSEIVWVPLAIEPSTVPTGGYHFYPYLQGSYVISPYIYMGRQGATKLFKDLTLILENSTVCHIRVLYRVDDDTTWTNLGKFETTLGTTQEFSSTYNVTGLRIQFLFMFVQVLFGHFSPKLKAAILRAFAKSEKNYVNTFTVLIEDDAKTKDGDPDDNFHSVPLKKTQLETWDSSPTALTVSSGAEIIDTKYMVLDTGYIAQLTLFELD